MIIKEIKGRMILDSRGNPTVECDIVLENDVMGRVSVPSGASTGSNEAVELRDGDANVFGGKGVTKAVQNINGEIAKVIVGLDVENQREIDDVLCALDGTENKSRLGANAILAVSLAAAKAAASSKQIPFYEYIGNLANNTVFTLPVPMVNIINGGKHASGSTDIQEIMIVPHGAKDFSHSIRMCTEVFHSLGKVLISKGYGTTVGDEGGYAPKISGNKEALDLISEAIQNCGYQLGTDIFFALDVASSELYEDEIYHLKTENKKLSSSEMINYYKELAQEYPIISIEDGLAENDWDGWKILNEQLGEKMQFVGDDLLVTNTKFLQKAIDEKSCNTILIKPNQIGTLSETLDAIKMAQNAGFATIISHRSGETEDTSIAHIAVGTNAGQIKTGSMSRTDRLCKYNELLRIEESLGDKAKYGKY